MSGVPREVLARREPDWGQTSDGPLCGVYSACLALQAIGIASAPEEFVTARFIGSSQGSTPLEVAAIVEAQGARATILQNLSVRDLRLLQEPFIANVRPTPVSSRYNHWALITFEDHGVTWNDGSQGAVDLTTAEFLGLWSGLGIVVSTPDAHVLSTLWMGRLLLLQLGVFVLLTLRLFAFSFGDRTLGFSRQLLGILASTFALLVILNAISGDIIHHWAGVRVATAPFTPSTFETGTLADVDAASRDATQLLIDARYSDDWAAGSVRHAINIPVTASFARIREFLSGIPRDARVVVFCQSKRCQFDEIVARNLALLGFEDITVSDEGWAEYNNRSDY